MDILDKLFGSPAKVRIMRMFLYNSGNAYDAQEISEKLKLGTAAVRREVSLLKSIGFLKSRAYSKEVKRGRGRKARIVKRRAHGWMLDPRFSYIPLLQKFLINTNLIRHKDIIRKLNSCGRIKLVILSGLFINDPESRVDMLIVGDGLKKGQMENVLRTIESQIGKDIRYASFETKDFNYRRSMFDKLIRDILDYPHEIIIDKVSLAENPQKVSVE